MTRLMLQSTQIASIAFVIVIIWIFNVA